VISGIFEGDPNACEEELELREFVAEDASDERETVWLGERDFLAKFPAFSPRPSVALLVGLLPSSTLALTTRRKLSRVGATIVKG
jgi:hypothetical protein